MQSSSASIAFLLLGWLLGLFSPIITDQIKNRLKRRALRVSFFTELDDIRERLVFMVHRIATIFGSCDRELLSWVRSNMKDSFDIVSNSGEPASAIIDRLLKLSDGELVNQDIVQKFSSGDSLSLKKFNLPLIESKLDSLALFELEFQRKLLDIRTRLNFINEEIEQAQFYFQKTFDTGLSEENEQRLTQNLKNSNLHISQLARVTVQKIESFIHD